MRLRIRSLKQTILSSFILLSIVCCVCLFYIAVRYSRRAVRNIAHDDIGVIADRINDTISEVMLEKYNFMEYTAKLGVLTDDDVDLREKQHILAALTSDKTKDLLSLSYIDEYGNTYFGPQLVNFISAPIVQQVLSEKKTVLLGPQADEITKELSINIGTPVYNTDGELKGLLLARFGGAFLSEISQRIRIGETGYGIFIDRNTGDTIGAPNIEDVHNKQNLMDLAKTKGFKDLEENMTKLMNGEDDWGYFEVQGVKRIMLFKQIPHTHWTVVVWADENEFIRKLHTMENIIFSLTVALIIISTLAAIFIVRHLNPLKIVGNAISEIATGNADLTKRITIRRGKKEIVDIVNGFNAFVTKMQEIVTSMKDSEHRLVSADTSLQNGTHETSAAITQIIANIESVNNQIIAQASSVEETAGAVNEIASNIESLERMIQNQSAGVTQASAAVEEMVGNINSVNHSVDLMFSSFKELEENATSGISTQNDVNEKIKQIQQESKTLEDANTAIASIASRTNLLAMNAAIESAHAGEAGKGFAVVADEIRKLSETSTAQSKHIGDELTKIQESIISVVEASSKASNAFKTVSQSIQNTDQLVQQIKAAMEEQQQGSVQITEALHSMNDSTVEVKSASTEMAEGNKHILSEVQSLQNVTTVIKESITEMSQGAQKINETGTELTDVSTEVTSSIAAIKKEIDLFKV